MCKKHKACSPDSIDDMHRETRPQPQNATACTDDSENTHEAIPQLVQPVICQSMIVSLISETCLFHLKLQGQLLVPASTIQIIVEEMQNVHELGQAYTIAKMSFFIEKLYEPIT